MSFKINSGFMTNYKLGDNIVFNLKTLNLLYSYYSKENPNNKLLLRKSMVILIASCCEAVLHDFYKRIRGNTREGVQGLKESVIDAIQNLKRIDKFELYITHAQKHDFFDGIHTDLYEVMSDLRKLRNRVHIQNEKNHFEPDDAKAFNEDRLIEAEKVFEAALRTMSSKYLRDPKYKHVDDFELPWSEHWPDGQW